MRNELTIADLEPAFDALLKDRTLFFCSGPPKSGTTLLQRALSLHPEVSCPSEQEFDFFINSYEDALTRYNEILTVVDSRTGGQGASLLDNRAAFQILKFTILAIVLANARGKRIVGANDNTVVARLEYYDALFERAKFVILFRHPLDQAVSSWHHNQRVEENFVARAKGFPEWILTIAKTWGETVRFVRDFARDRSDVLTLRYEDLVNDKHATLTKTFGFLGASTADAVVRDICSETDFQAMKRRSPFPEFFRAAATDQGGEAVAAELKDRVREACADELAFLNY